MKSMILEDICCADVDVVGKNFAGVDVMEFNCSDVCVKEERAVWFAVEFCIVGDGWLEIDVASLDVGFNKLADIFGIDVVDLEKVGVSDHSADVVNE